MTEKASIIILTYNNLDYTRMCLESIYSRTGSPDFEIIVVDNASQDDTPQFLQQFAQTHPNVRLVLSSINHGFPRGNNLGAAQATGDYIVFLNNDTIVTEGWLAGLIRHLQDPTVGMVGPATNSSGNETRIPVGYQDIKDMPAFARQYTSTHVGQSFEISMLAFLCVAMRRQVFEEVGPLEEMFGRGMFEDDDYAMRVKRKGYRILCADDVFIHHWGSASFSRITTSSYFKLFKENRRKFEGKWGEKWQPPLLRPELLAEQARWSFEWAMWLADVIIQQDERIHELEQNAGGAKAPLKPQEEAPAPRYAGGGLRQSFSELAQELRATRRDFGLFKTITGLPGRVRRTSTFRRLIDRVIRSLPKPVQSYYDRLQDEYPYLDRSEVMLYASPDVMPGYARRAALDRPAGSTTVATGQAQVKVSVVATVRDNAPRAREWLSVLLSQSRLPDEIILVDLGSTGSTAKTLQEIAPSFAIPMRVIEAPGANPARGWNLAIQIAQHEVVACTHIDCIPEKDWLHDLILPFEADEQIEISAGVTDAIQKDVLDQLGARFWMNDLETDTPQTYLTSSRSLAMKKKFWATAGGFPEWLSGGGEDAVFHFQAKSQPARWAFVPQARVSCRAPRFLGPMFRNYYQEATGHGEAGVFRMAYSRSAQKTAKTWLLRGLFLLLAILALFAASWATWLLLAVAATWLVRFMLDVLRTAREQKLGIAGAILYLWIDETVSTARALGYARGAARRDPERRQASQLTTR